MVTINEQHAPWKVQVSRDPNLAHIYTGDWEELPLSVAEAYGDTPAETLNHARLISAAPDLLAALERVGAKQFDGTWHTVTCYPNYLGPGSICLGQCVQARAAIAKARGE